MAERIKLQIQNVKDIEKVGTNQVPKLTFSAKSGDGPVLWYQTFKTSLFETINKKGEIDCEIETKEREVNGNVYTDRKVTQIYIDGEPVGGQKKQWQPRQDSPEQRRSIERQTALKAAVELASYPESKVQEILNNAETFYIWISGEKRIIEPPKKTIEPIQEAPKSKSDGVKGETKEKVRDKDSKEPTTIKELLEWCLSHGKQYGPSWLNKEAGVSRTDEIKDIQGVYESIKSVTGWE